MVRYIPDSRETTPCPAARIKNHLNREFDLSHNHTSQIWGKPFQNSKPPDPLNSGILRTQDSEKNSRRVPTHPLEPKKEELHKSNLPQSSNYFPPNHGGGGFSHLTPQFSLSHRLAYPGPLPASGIAIPFPEFPSRPRTPLVQCCEMRKTNRCTTSKSEQISVRTREQKKPLSIPARMVLRQHSRLYMNFCQSTFLREGRKRGFRCATMGLW